MLNGNKLLTATLSLQTAKAFWQCPAVCSSVSTVNWSEAERPSVISLRRLKTSPPYCSVHIYRQLLTCHRDLQLLAFLDKKLRNSVGSTTYLTVTGIKTLCCLASSLYHNIWKSHPALKWPPMVIQGHNCCWQWKSWCDFLLVKRLI